jgi:gamma-glutamyl phosphate reductase
MENKASFDKTIREMAAAARDAARIIGRCSADLKNKVLLDIATELQAGNAVILRGGSEALDSNKVGIRYLLLG